MEQIFPIVIIIAIVEMILSAMWSKFYFSVGIPIFVYEIPNNFAVSDRKNAHDLGNAMLDTKYAPMKFKQLSKNTIAFRESYWSGFFKRSYTPVMHGNLQYTERGKIKVTGLVNWFTVAFSIMFFSLPFTWGSEDPIIFIFPIFLVALIGWIFFTQKKRYINIAEIASGKHKHA
jgi:hypothetical protein